MLVALIWDGGLAAKVNTIEEFVAEAKAYKTSIKTVAHYLECSSKQCSGKITSLAAAHHGFTKEVCMCKVKVASKGTLTCAVLKAIDKKCLVMWVKMSSHKVWTLWDSKSTTSSNSSLYACDWSEGVTINDPHYSAVENDKK
ncbi:hypothetical protein C0995_011643 [Termitomyces sp. Mi166|nr:hypothetical protein C0995_011643 [Termitomyces sp. Mi166\